MSGQRKGKKKVRPQLRPFVKSVTSGDIRWGVRPEIFRAQQGVTDFQKKLERQLRRNFRREDHLGK